MMVQWQFCECGRIIDEYENKCHWCGKEKVPDNDEDEEDDDGNI